MGKMLLFFIAAATVGGTVLLSQGLDTERIGNERKTLDEAQLLAREIARSGYALGVSRVNAAFYERPVRDDLTYEGISFGEGNYDLYVLELPCGAMRVTSTGRMTVPVRDAQGNASSTRSHTIQGDFVGLVEMPGAVLVDARNTDDVTVEASGTNFGISGEDQRPACQDVAEESWEGCPTFATVRKGMGRTVPPVVTNNGLLPTLYNGTAFSIETAGSFPAYVQEIYDRARELATMPTPDPYVHRFTSNREFASTHYFGSPTEPVVMLVEGDAKFTGYTTGYGILIVNGNFEANNNFTWGGLIYVVKGGELEVRFRGNSRVFGSVVVQNPAPLPGSGGPLRLRIGDQAKIYYSEESVGLLASRIDAIVPLSRIARINERHTPATVFPQLECPGPTDTPQVEAPPPCACRAGKVLIKHFPPGNQSNVQEICISENAWPAHERLHNDELICQGS